MVYLRDSSALLVLYRREPGAERVAARFAEPEHEFLICAVSVAESGRKLRELGVSGRELENILDTFLPMFSNILAADEEVARTSLRLIEQVPARLPLADSLIAAAAISRSACLMHRDKHMAAIPETILPQFSLY